MALFGRLSSFPDRSVPRALACTCPPPCGRRYVATWNVQVMDRALFHTDGLLHGCGDLKVWSKIRILIRNEVQIANLYLRVWSRFYTPWLVRCSRPYEHNFAPWWVEEEFRFEMRSGFWYFADPWGSNRSSEGLVRRRSNPDRNIHVSCYWQGGVWQN